MVPRTFTRPRVPKNSAERGQTTYVQPPAAGLVVLHYDHDFDLIASVTQQPVEWIVPAGRVP